MSRKESIVERELSSLTLWSKIVMVVMLPVFAVIAQSAIYQLIVPKEKLQKVFADEIKAVSEEKENN